MKKLISLLLAAAFIYTALLCACTNKPEETSAPVTETGRYEAPSFTPPKNATCGPSPKFDFVKIVKILSHASIYPDE